MPTIRKQLTTDDLNMAQISQWLADNQLPDAATFLLPGSVGPSSLGFTPLTLNDPSQPLALAIGQTAVTFTASTTSATATVTHGLKRLPFVVLCGPINNAAFTAAASSYATTTFVLQGGCTSAVTGSVTVAWAALG